MEKLGWRNHTKVRNKPYVKTQPLNVIQSLSRLKN